MQVSNIRFILTDIEGTTSSVTFVYEVLFPYFTRHIARLKELQHLPTVKEAFGQTVKLAKEEEDLDLATPEEIIETLRRWSSEDKKITPLKTLQGVLWEEGYTSGEIRGHVYPDVLPALKHWKEQGVRIGVFSSGSVAAQKLIFGYSEAGDLTPYFSAYFDTVTGGKRDTETYVRISEELGTDPENILFLSDIGEELSAADEAGFRTIQLVRPGTEAIWKHHVADFSEIELIP